MELNKRILAFVRLKNFFDNFLNNNFRKSDLLFQQYETFAEIVKTEYLHNGWFTEENIKYSIGAISDSLSEQKIEIWLSKYNIVNVNKKLNRVGVILAGNLPLVGFHDFLCVLITGNIFVGKMSSKDNRLLKTVSQILVTIEPEFANYILYEENQLKNIDAVIATGSNNSARYFEYYFGKYPNIIRKNRNSIAIFEGNETQQQVEKLADDIFTYFGLGCRNVSKIYIPDNFDIKRFFEGVFKYSEIINHNKYANNYAYNRTIYLMNSVKFYDNNFVMLKEDTNLSSPVSVVFFEYYSDIKDVIGFIKNNSDKLQCVSTDIDITEIETIKLGNTQKPELWDYADNIDTIEFLLNL